MRALAVVGLLLACSEEHQPGPPPTQWCEVRYDIPMGIDRSLDLLFVIDRSPAMAGEQASLTEVYRRWIETLETFEGGIPDVHIGVISADLADDGLLQGGGYLADLEQPDGTRVRNYDGSLADAFAARAALGADGSELAAPLETMRRALDGSHPENEGFLRATAVLFLGIVAASDDASGAPVSDYVAFARGKKPIDPLRVLVTAAFPGSAGARLARFLAGFPNRNTFIDLQQGDLGEMLLQVAQAQVRVLGSPCLGGRIDTTDLEPDDPGLQLACSSVLGDEPLERCRLGADELPTADTPRPCWWVAPDAVNCANTETQLTLKVELATWPAPGTTLVTRCVAEC